MTEFKRILQEHRARYPEMGPQDFCKLAFQSEFGPEHMVSDRDSALDYLRQEWSLLSRDCPPLPPEPIGNGLYRFHLSACGEEGLPLLAEAFCRSAREHRGTREGLEARLAQVRALDVPGMEAWLAQYRASGYPPVHHSRIFREIYQPHYRVIRLEYLKGEDLNGSAVQSRGFDGR